MKATKTCECDSPLFCVVVVFVAFFIFIRDFSVKMVKVFSSLCKIVESSFWELGISSTPCWHEQMVYLAKVCVRMSECVV